jgi:hypothetical protein
MEMQSSWHTKLKQWQWEAEQPQLASTQMPERRNSNEFFPQKSAAYRGKKAQQHRERSKTVFQGANGNA